MSMYGNVWDKIYSDVFGGFSFSFFPFKYSHSVTIHVQSAVIVVMLIFGFVSEDQPHSSALPIPN